jgi:hypothetical protein
MLDDLTILCFGGAAVMALFVIAGLLAKYFDWK